MLKKRSGQRDNTGFSCFEAFWKVLEPQTAKGPESLSLSVFMHHLPCPSPPTHLHQSGECNVILTGQHEPLGGQNSPRGVPDLKITAAEKDGRAEGKNAYSVLNYQLHVSSAPFWLSIHLVLKRPVVFFPILVFLLKSTFFSHCSYA